MICPTCKIIMLQCKYCGGGIYWTCSKCGCKIESTGFCCDVYEMYEEMQKEYEKEYDRYKNDELRKEYEREMRGY